MTVKLYSSTNVLQGTTTTNASGIYGFSGLVPGNYYVVVTLPSTYTFTTRDAGSNDAIDSDATAWQNDSAPFCRTERFSSRTWLCISLPVFTGYVIRVRQRRHKESGETGIANATVKLLDAGGNVVATRPPILPACMSSTTCAPASIRFARCNPGLS